jgi:hypothetical protein
METTFDEFDEFMKAKYDLNDNHVAIIKNLGLYIFTEEFIRPNAYAFAKHFEAELTYIVENLSQYPYDYLRMVGRVMTFLITGKNDLTQFYHLDLDTAITEMVQLATDIRVEQFRKSMDWYPYPYY